MNPQSLVRQTSVLACYTMLAFGTSGVPGSISPLFFNCVADYSAVTDRGLEPAATRLKASWPKPSSLIGHIVELAGLEPAANTLPSELQPHIVLWYCVPDQAVKLPHITSGTGIFGNPHVTNLSMIFLTASFHIKFALTIIPTAIIDILPILSHHTSHLFLIMNGLNKFSSISIMANNKIYRNFCIKIFTSNIKMTTKLRQSLNPVAMIPYFQSVHGSYSSRVPVPIPTARLKRLWKEPLNILCNCLKFVKLPAKRLYSGLLSTARSHP